MTRPHCSFTSQVTKRGVAGKPGGLLLTCLYGSPFASSAVTCGNYGRVSVTKRWLSPSSPILPSVRVIQPQLTALSFIKHRQHKSYFVSLSSTHLKIMKEFFGILSNFHFLSLFPFVPSLLRSATCSVTSTRRSPFSVPVQ